MKNLSSILKKHSGRDSRGHVSMRHQGGRHKRFYRTIDWLRDKDDIPAIVSSIEYDPNRSSDIALLTYRDGEKRYVIAPVGLTVGQAVASGETVDIKIGNALPLRSIPIGTIVHNLEIKPGSGAQMVRSAGSSAVVLAKDQDSIQIKLPSGEIRVFHGGCKATIGQIGNVDRKNQVIGKAGRSRHMGRRPTVRGVAQNPRSHPHGGGEGRSGIGMPSPKSPWGKPTLGKRTRKRVKYSDQFIVSRKKK
ncbi:MAG: 50S ribosomal protein L2 [Candidatus Gottesmanbacteria bacterium GW2011_GWA2_44_17]|uniref:Large ribosomal subunit protein uL2 n=3 Tax=Candidatus Gottesmaniibacteriota TaxID=1752720 RepID=A0A0G1LMT9_9BACT|nr:MAG: 50S ribosomal protein L2 [Microgenomates group bacterium GW2011_GWC1_43_11]KKT38654.1 MAG: 50S ribosomal protein L2 [Candidatus Gottesmanbacteria bacterium GW2011_GWB1_44_11c]KKT47349.1 MAG: 50S ribosomal protein L2 [Candidatus Gottesmanbacteria bacterium GW2011_GWA2_44_17]KKT61149.1 MAG: 50S ribosomal protein L2 [Candidatus Gottesmanbacteria bacterium GW2011_GWA1_44_24b]